MAVRFTSDDWARICDRYRAFWNHTSPTPLIPVTLTGRDPGRPQPAAPVLSQQTALDLSFSAEAMIDRLDYELSRTEFLGDAFPHVNMDCFGPGVLAAFLGAVPDNRTGRIWFHPREVLPLSQLHFTYDPENIWWNRVRDLYRAAAERWGGEVIMGMVDLGGILDVLAVFRGTENLLMDLYDEPDEVHRLVDELHELWMRYYTELCGLRAPDCPGCTDWSGIFSERPSYILQSDFSYMIGNDLFREFVLGDLRRFIREIPNTIYHMDGPGELRHFDDLLKPEDLNAIQWVPGEGNPTQEHWPEVYTKLAAAGKGTQVFCSAEDLDIIGRQTGDLHPVRHSGIHSAPDGREDCMALLNSFGVPVC